MQHRIRTAPDGVGIELTVMPEKPAMKGQQVRERLSHAVLCLLVNSSTGGKRMTSEEMEWAIKSLQWINWHAGRVGGQQLIEGTWLVSDTPERAYP